MDDRCFEERVRLISNLERTSVYYKTRIVTMHLMVRNLSFSLLRMYCYIPLLESIFFVGMDLVWIIPG